MAFIGKKDPVVLNIKLTSKGRELLSEGKLDFKYYAIGDSEIDYVFNKAIIDSGDSEYSAFNSTILRPADKNPDLISFIPKNVSGDPYNELTNVPSTAYVVENQVESLGFFTNDNTEFITDSNHVKQPDVMIDMGGVTGGSVVTLLKSETYGTSGEEPAIGDILFVRWTRDTNTTGFTVNNTHVTPNLFYRIKEVNGTLSSGSVNVTVDRDIPNFSGLSLTGINAGAMIYYNEINFSGDTILNMSATDYLDESVLSFLENSQCPTVVFPYWNMSVIFTEEIAGVQSGDTKYTQFKNRTMGGFVLYIQNQAPTLKKLGVVHYTNSSPANVYAEGFKDYTPTLDIPTIMWHKSPTKTLGTTLAPIGVKQLLTGLNLYYFDLADSEGFVVGKMFSDLKIFVIEDQELLFAMSYKTNRSWTLPNYVAGTTIVPSQPPPPTPEPMTVTWLYPDDCDNSSVLSIVCAQYCHSGLPTWTNFTTNIWETDVCDAGYRVWACQCGGSFDCSDICTYAIDAVTCVTIDECKISQDPGNCKYCNDLTNINNSGKSYYFKGNLCLC